MCGNGFLSVAVGLEDGYAWAGADGEAMNNMQLGSSCRSNSEHAVIPHIRVGHTHDRCVHVLMKALVADETRRAPREEECSSTKIVRSLHGGQSLLSMEADRAVSQQINESMRAAAPDHRALR
ncbi:unnamed protein product [Toxocara canis]|uniref:Uncharacterized protein n=1 Tax=Toxocara canis TaxID=6265 RepID=A0A183UFC0_TOXCA|nr:unnamed protein product [Toxocara canis]